MLDLYNNIIIKNNIYFKEDNKDDKIYDKDNIVYPKIEDLKENKIYDKDNTDYPKIEDLKEAPTNTGDTYCGDSIINKTIEYNSNYKISEEREDNNYQDFSISKIKKLLTLKNNKLSFSEVYVLKDGRIIANTGVQKDEKKFLCYVFDLKNDICFSLNFKKIKGIFKLEDGMVVIAIPDEILLINIKINNYEIIQSIKVELFHVHKLTNDKV